MSERQNVGCWRILCGGILLLALLTGCQERQEATVTLTQAQWDEVRANILQEPPGHLKSPSGAVFGDLFELVGMEVKTPNPQANQDMTIVWYWKALKTTTTNYQFFVHLERQGKPSFRQGLDHYPMRDLYPTSKWEAGQIIKDVQTVRLRNNFPGGKATFWVGAWDPASKNRLDVSSPGKSASDGNGRVNAGTVSIKGKKKAPKPTYVARPLQGEITIDGKIEEDAWKKSAWTRRFGSTQGGKGAPGTSRARALYDENFLYLALEGDDKDVWGELEGRDAKTWTQEVFEIFIDPDGDAKDYVEIQVTPKNTVFDARFPVKLGKGKGSRQEQIDAAKAWNCKMETAAHVQGTLNKHDDTDKSWSVELKIPFADLPGQTPKPGTSWKINFYRFDLPRDPSGKPKKQIAWSWTPAYGFFHNVEHFGTIRFVGQGDSTSPRIQRGKKVTPPRDPEAVEPDRPE